MFDFERLEVYQCIKKLNVEILKHFASRQSIDAYLSDQLRRATISIALNIAEGCGRHSRADKKRFYVIARASVFECVSILQVICEMQMLEESTDQVWYSKYESISKMLLSLYRNAKGFDG